jgi:hypothetical protein
MRVIVLCAALLLASPSALRASPRRTVDARPPEARPTLLHKLAGKLQSVRSLWTARPALASKPGASLRSASPAPTLQACRRGDVYLDYPFEDVKFRYEKQTGKVFRRFNGQPDQEVSFSSNLFRDALSAGKLISRQEYYR